LAANQDADRFVGTWFSHGGDFTNITTLHTDGRFHTERLLGVELVGTIDGRWLVRNDAFVWTYEKPAAAGEDVNPILSEAHDRFTLREMDGSSSSFFRKGIVDPASPEWLPVAVGTGWVMKDDAGQFTIRVSLRENIAGHDCYRVDWIEGSVTYQSEYWIVAEDGVRVAGRLVAGQPVEFSRSYLLLKRELIPGESWEASLSLGILSDDLTFSVGAAEDIQTPAGSFRAVPVTARGRTLQYRRWYARGVGLIQEEATMQGDMHINTKILERRIK